MKVTPNIGRLHLKDRQTRRKAQSPRHQAPRPQNEHVPAPAGWTKTFTDPRLCAAIVDRLTFAGQIIETGTTSYRLAQSRKKRSAASTRPG